MSVLLEAVDAELAGNPNNNTTKPYVVTKDVLYADDTMLLATHAGPVQRHLDAIVHVGKSFGLELNAAKTILLRLR